MQRTYGGQVLAQAPDGGLPTRFSQDRIVHSLHAYFLRPGSVDSTDITYLVDAARDDGNTFSTRRVTATQEKEIFSMSASFHAKEPGLNHDDPMPREVPGPDQCPTLVEVLGARFGGHPIWHEWDAIDVRFVGDSSPGGSITDLGRHVASMRVWVRTQATTARRPRGFTRRCWRTSRI